MVRTVRPGSLLIRPLLQEEPFGTVKRTITLDSREPLVLRRDGVKVSGIERGSLGGVWQVVSAGRAWGMCN